MEVILLGVTIVFLGIYVYNNSREAQRKTTVIWKRLASLEDEVKSLKAAVEEVQGRLRRKTVPVDLEDLSARTQEPASADVASLSHTPVSEQLPSPPAETEESLPAAEPLKPDRRPSSTEEVKPPRVQIDWEKFTGAQLFAWVGGFALFLGVAFLIKYSMEQGLLSPAVRVAGGFLIGAGSILGGLRVWSRGYPITAHCLCAVGPAILYAVIYASYDLYRFIGVATAFSLMVLVTVVAFYLAVRLESRYIALLGLLGGFLTPFLVSSGQDNPLGLFGYVAILVIGLALVALRLKWGPLIGLSALGTLATQAAWVGYFFDAEKALTGFTIFIFFALLYAGLGVIAERNNRSDQFIELAAAGIPVLSLFFAMLMLTYPELAARPGLVFSFVFLVNLILAGLAVFDDKYESGHLQGGALAFILLMWWTSNLTPELLGWGLAAYLVFAILHAAFPLVLQKVRSASPLASWWGTFYPALMLLPIVALTLQRADSFVVWPVVFLINTVAVLTAMVTGLLWVGVAVLALTLGIVWIDLLQLNDATGLAGLLGIMTFFVLVFFVIGILVEHLRASRTGSETGKGLMLGIGDDTGPFSELLRLPVLSALLPFLLLSTVCLRLDLANPAPVFGLGMLLVLLLLGLVYFFRTDVVSLVALGAAALLQLSWHVNSFDPTQPVLALPWYLGFFTLFVGYPVLFQQAMQDRLLPWWAAALAGPFHFYLVYDVVANSVGTAWIGILPALFALLYLGVLTRIVRSVHLSAPARKVELALFGAAALFFVTLIFPLQFEKEWLTISWALEGAALIWLFRKVPHSGLKKWGFALMAIAFVRLALNPAVLDYHPRATVPILNWYLYAYGIVAISLFYAARLWRPLEESFFGKPVRPILHGLGTILAFLLLNIEIADFFSTGITLTFQFGQTFAQDMTYSLAWALFGLLLLVLGIRLNQRAARLASLGLISVTTLKLFFYDLWSLGQLYRVAAFVGLAVILILVSSLYQKHMSSERPESKSVSQ